MQRSILLLADHSIQRFDGAAIEQWQAAEGSVLWLDLIREDSGAEEKLLQQLNVHPLAIQDAQRDRHPPKVEEFDTFTFLLYRGFDRFGDDLDVNHIQVAFFVGKNYLVTYHSGTSIGIENWWDKDKDLKTLLAKPGMLLTRILATSMNAYLQGMLKLENTLTSLEDEMLNKPTDTVMQALVIYRSRLRKLNRIFSYHERVISQILQEPTEELDVEDVALYHAMQDVYDKCERLNSLSKLFYDQCGDLVEGHLSLTSHQLNKTMQALTVITAIFIPLGLLAGIYGMNFENMPELHTRYGYYILLGTMVMIATTLLALFKRKGWL